MLDSINGEIIDQVKEVVDSSIKQQLDTREPTKLILLISDMVNGDFDKLSAVFLAKVGCTLETFIEQRKIEKVKEFLVYTDLSLEEIAHVLGYTSTSHLSDQLEKHTGCTSSHYKQVRREKLIMIENHKQAH